MNTGGWIVIAIIIALLLVWLFMLRRKRRPGPKAETRERRRYQRRVQRDRRESIRVESGTTGRRSGEERRKGHQDPFKNDPF